jgi:hypothetical protein
LRCSARRPRAMTLPGTGICGRHRRLEGRDRRHRRAGNLGSRRRRPHDSGHDRRRPKPYLPSWSASGIRCPSTWSTCTATTTPPTWRRSSPRALPAGKLGKVEQPHDLVKQPHLHRPVAPNVDRVVIDPSLGRARSGPARLHGRRIDFAFLNAGQIPFVEERMPDQIAAERDLCDELHRLRHDQPALRQRRRAQGALLTPSTATR